MKNILITGTNSGLGKYLHSRFGGAALTRATTEKEWRTIRRRHFDMVVHCAAVAPQSVPFERLAPVMDDNVLLTCRLLRTKCKYFVYISSVAVYPPGRRPHAEEEKLIPEQAGSIYALTKMISEALVQASKCESLILRPCSLIGKESRMNNIMRIISRKKPRLSLSAKSRYNLVFYKDLADFIEFAFQRRLTGIYNVAASKSMSLAAIARLTGHKPIYGRHYFAADNICNAKITGSFPVFHQTSEEVLKKFLKDI